MLRSLSLDCPARGSPASFRLARPLNLSALLIAYPVEQSRVNLSGWWMHPRTVQLLHREYVKYLASLVTTRLAHG